MFYIFNQLIPCQKLGLGSFEVRDGNRLGRPTKAYDLAYIKPDLNWSI